MKYFTTGGIGATSSEVFDGTSWTKLSAPVAVWGAGIVAINKTVVLLAGGYFGKLKG